MAHNKTKTFEELKSRQTVGKSQHRLCLAGDVENRNRKSLREIAKILNENGLNGNHTSVQTWLNLAFQDILNNCQRQLKLDVARESNKKVILESNLIEFENCVEDLIFSILEADREFLESILE